MESRKDKDDNTTVAIKYPSSINSNLRGGTAHFTEECLLMFKRNMMVLCMSIAIGWLSPVEAKTSLSKASACVVNTNHMPQYQVSFSLPDPENEFLFRYVVLRFFQAWGNGDSTGWQVPITMPTATLENESLNVRPLFVYSPSYSDGSEYLGFDQYAQYYTVGIPYKKHALDSKVVITGPVQQVAYLSATLYSDDSRTGKVTQTTILDKEMMTEDNGCNPYIEGNPSIFSYPSTSQPTLFKNINSSLDATRFLQHQSLNKLSKALVNTDISGSIPVFRLDKESSEEDSTDDIAPDGCSRAYLVAYKSEDQKIVILRIKVPTTFIDSNNPDKIFGKYQTRYLSVGSHRTNPQGPSDKLLTYWAVNARMLKDYMDEDGYAYVFFAPNSYTNDLAIQQNTPPTQPPVMTWGRYKGYLLGEPDFAIILRYRDPDSSWKGSPENAICYATYNEVKPVTKEELGEYTPEIYADTMEHFLSGRIGAVSKDGTWPS